MTEEARPDDLAAESLLQDLVAIPGVTGKEGPAVRHLVDWMAANGYDEAYVDDIGNAVGILGSGDRDLLLLGHIDTFPGELPVRRQGRLLYGRGTVDARGPLCAFAVAGTRATLPRGLRLVLVGAVEEEGSSCGARHLLGRYQPWACVIGEPSRADRITLGYKGRLLVERTWRGPLAHSAGQGQSPAENAVAWWLELLKWAERHNEGVSGLFDRLDVTLQDIETGQDGAWGETSLTAGFRLPLRISPQELEAKLPGAGESASLIARGHEHAWLSPRDNLLSRAFRRAIRQHGARPRFVTKTGTSDMNLVAPVWNCPIVAYGPGDSALDHTPDEHVDLDEYLLAIEVLVTMIESIAPPWN
ncbi:MAG: [LysW]-lysine hydrolase [Anaerolineaceae bacterium]|nr:[LysW]-lysine hydrolase [Anaerolineaceae bacterium]